MKFVQTLVETYILMNVIVVFSFLIYQLMRKLEPTRFKVVAQRDWLILGQVLLFLSLLIPSGMAVWPQEKRFNLFIPAHPPLPELISAAKKKTAGSCFLGEFRAK